MSSVMIVAGEASGDLHGGSVVRALRSKKPECEIFGIGGDAMSSAGMILLHHVSEMNFLGFAEVVRHLPFIRKVLRECEDALRLRKPDVLLLIDYPGFNLKLARIAHRMGIRVVFYISPQVWAWKAGRVKKMRGVIDKMLVIFEFEKEIYLRENIPVVFVGHPLVELRIADCGLRIEDEEVRNAEWGMRKEDGAEEMRNAEWGMRKEDGEMRNAKCEMRKIFFERHDFRMDIPLVGMFPGSRRQEIEMMLPTFVDVARLLKSSRDVQFAVAAAPTVAPEILEAGLAGAGIVVLRNQTNELQQFCDVALTKSGTSTLELAVAGTPMVVLYKTSALSYRIGKSFALIDSIAMPNIVAGKKIVPEFVQHEATAENIAKAVRELLTNNSARETMRMELKKVRETLGTPGAAERVADEVIAMMPR